MNIYGNTLKTRFSVTYISSLKILNLYDYPNCSRAWFSLHANKMAADWQNGALIRIFPMFVRLEDYNQRFGEGIKINLR